MVSEVSRSAKEASQDDDDASGYHCESDDGKAVSDRFGVRDRDGWCVLCGLVVIAGTQGQDDPGYRQEEFLQAVWGWATVRQVVFVWMDHGM